MGGVDLSDQLLQPYSALRKAKVWYKKLSVYIVQMAMLNAFLLSRCARHTDTSYLQFQEVVFKALLFGTREGAGPSTSGTEGGRIVPGQHFPGKVPQTGKRGMKNKYVKFFKSKPSLPPGLSHIEPTTNKTQQSTKPETETTPLSKTAKRNMKRKEKRKQEKGERGAVEEVRQDMEKISISQTEVQKDTANSENADAEKAKKLKNLRKKLRQVEDLQQKIDSGEIKQASKEQLEKLGRRKALEEEIEDLELDL
ncbi:unnamed protein product [Ranitomeya imitator]|uniref:PiggyBac transposable element-derived protein domain-containing protein n=1 Tax=Ranitomeya imitator TaxID=111125 RepID=A0ABN9LQ23_9NEOB|nr:unnamed protein product [Ranitomeya imitator]